MTSAAVAVIAATTLPLVVRSGIQRAQVSGAQQLESLLNSARDVARAELRCVTIGVSMDPPPNFAGVGFRRSVLGSVHPCTTSLYAPPYAGGAPAPGVVERTLFDFEITPEAFGRIKVGQQFCAPPNDCLEPPAHGFGDIVELRTDGSTDAVYALKVEYPDGRIEIWDIQPATGTIRRRPPGVPAPPPPAPPPPPGGGGGGGGGGALPGGLGGGGGGDLPML